MAISWWNGNVGKSQPAIGAGVKNDSEVKNLEKHFDREDASEDVVEVGQHHVPGHDGDLWTVIMMIIMEGQYEIPDNHDAEDEEDLSLFSSTGSSAARAKELKMQTWRHIQLAF